MERRSTAYSLQGVYCAVVWLSIVARLAVPCLVLSDVIQGWVLDLRNAHELRRGDGGFVPAFGRHWAQVPGADSQRLDRLG